MKVEEVALIANSKDNVTAARVEMPIGMILEFKRGHVIVRSEIPFGHKLTLVSIPKGDHMVRYGEPIGVETQDILLGEHVHSHKLEGKQGRGK